MDRLTKEHRSWNMSRIRGKDTSPEHAVRSLLHRLGFRFRLHQRSLPGTPDIVLSRYRTVIFVHGCFWHQHKKCQFAYSPKSRRAFWAAKFRNNQRRDARLLKELENTAWHVLVVWECELRSAAQLSKRLEAALVRRGRAVKRAR
jgi:DNA mismatch endonuclease, patch repair protein